MDQCPLPKIISKNNETPYLIKYDNIDVSLSRKLKRPDSSRPEGEEKDSLRKTAFLVSVQKK
jgi:hypothetical protein